MKSHLNILKKDSLNALELMQVFELWNNEYPKQLDNKKVSDLEMYLSQLSSIKHIILINNINHIEGWAYTFFRDNENWFAIILSSTIQGEGWGLKIIEILKQMEIDLNGWVVDHNNYFKQNGQVYNSPLNFYQKLGFKIVLNEKLDSEQIAAVKINWNRRN